MKNLIWTLIAVIGMGGYAILTCWIVALQRKIRDLERDQRARALLRLADKPYLMPKQQDHEIQIVQKSKEPEPEPRCDYKNRSARHVDG